MAKDKKKVNLMQHEGVETGYFDKRRQEFNEQVRKGIGEDPKPPKPKKISKRKQDDEKDN